MTETEYSVYIVRCKDHSYYTGIAADVARRLKEHESGRRGAKYLKGRGPLTLVFSQVVGNRSQALQSEHRIKRLSRTQKEALIGGSLTQDSVIKSP